MNPPVQAEAPRRASGWAMAARIGLPVLLFVGLAYPAPRADDWGGLVTISATMGVSDGRICTGESSRGDIGCAANAPYVSRATGNVGIGLAAPAANLDVSGSIRAIANGTWSVVSAESTNAISYSPLFLLKSARTGIQPLLAGNWLGALQWRSIVGESASIFSVASANHSSTSTPATILFNTTPANATTTQERMRITDSGNIGISTSIPTEKLEVVGNIKATAFIGDGSGLTNLPGSSGNAGDRLTSGTAYVQTNNNGTVTISGTTYIGYQTATTASLEIGSAPTASRNAHIDFTGDTTYSDFGLRIIRTNGGANTSSSIIHRGNGDFRLTTQDAAPIVFATAGSEAMRILPSGNVGIGTAIPAAHLDVSGTVSATTLQLADNPANPCTAATKGMAKVVNGRIYVCRYP